MRKIIMSLAVASLAIPATFVFPVDQAQAKKHVRHYQGRSYTYARCRHSPGTTGLIAGGVGGAVLGDSVIGHGPLGAIVGAGAGALGGRAIDRSMTARQRGC